MTSRLDRLFILLESGSSAVTRRAAAKQIGEVQKLHPHELHILLNRLIVYLHNSSWDTRIAAAQAVEAILANVPVWNPKPSPIKNETKCNINYDAGRLKFDNFDLANVLQKGARLMGSEGSEFDMQDGAEIDDREHLLRQRALLNEKLGFSKSGISIHDLVSLDDMRMQTNRNYDPNLRLMPVQDILMMDSQQNSLKNVGAATTPGGSSGGVAMPLSCREMNRARRKARQQNPIGGSTGSSASGVGGSSSVSGSNSGGISRSNSNSNGSMGDVEPERKKLKSTESNKLDNVYYSSEPVPDGGTGTWIDAIDWPFEAFCSRLYLDLFSPRWETRHGAATALRELLKSHSIGAGKSTFMTKDEMNTNHLLWLEDAALRLLCVLSLDRFGDFISDQVVAPVRETCAQVLGAVMKEMPLENFRNTVVILMSLIKQQEWEVRHGGLLGIKYMLVVREDLLQTFLPITINDILMGLFDSVDDVGAVAAATLIPIASWLPKLLNYSQVSNIIKMLWDLLLDQDELTSACNSFMGLLSAILSLNDASQWVEMEQMSVLVPRLWPFLSHTTSSVRRSTLQTLKTLTQRPTVVHTKDNTTVERNGNATCNSNGNGSTSSSIASGNVQRNNFGVQEWPPQLLQEALRHLYQRVLIEPIADIQVIIEIVWNNLVTNAELSALLHAACPYVASWMCLAMQPARLSFDPSLMIYTKPPLNRKNKWPELDSGNNVPLLHQKMYLGGTETTPIDIREKNIPQARCRAAKMLGLLSKYLVLPAPGVAYTPDVESPISCYTKILIGYLTSRSALQRLISGMVIAFWTENDTSILPGPPQLQERLNIALVEYVYYDEVAILLTRLLQEARDFIATLKQHKIPLTEFDNCKVLTLDQIQALSTTMTENLRQRFGIKPKLCEILDERRRGLQNSFQSTNFEQNSFNISTQAVLAGATVYMGCLPEKLNPVVKPIMESIKREECEIFQQLSAQYLVKLMDQVCNRIPCPNNKIVTNICTLLKSDADFTPKIMNLEKFKFGEYAANEVTESNPYYGIYTLTSQQKISEIQNGLAPRGPGRPPNVETTIDDSTEVEDPSKKFNRVQRIGASYAIKAICLHFGAQLPIKVPVIWTLIDSLKTTATDESIAQLYTEIINVDQANELVTVLQLIEVATPHLHQSLHDHLFSLMPQLSLLLKHPLKTIRHLTARCLSTMAMINASPVMDMIVEKGVILLQAIENVTHRQGAAEAIACIVHTLQFKIVPYVILLVVPLLGRMSDPDQSVRLISTHCFATLIQLMPLDGNVNELTVLSPELQKRKIHDRKFLEYLLTPKKIPDYKVPIEINAELRGYQQSGVNWLWFLNKYKLHGILCDDMGLGKTLQTICILAGDHFERQQTKLQNLPSLVICPPTLTGHWVYEVSKFLPNQFLRPLHYVGLPADRERLRYKMGTHNLVVASYDIVRKDVEFFASVHWNYVVLDEGHIIKNGKTKSSKAIKQLVANHRLILSGTPIQNNVLELWSLFDFLMPGFLGTEKQFICKFSRPILASRDAKSSDKEQEAGALAMEALHRQVLPFLLRRVKEDVLTDLPPKITQDLLCELSTLQVRLYEDFSKTHLNSDIKDCIENMDGNNKDVHKKTHVFQALRYLQNVCNHPKLVLTEHHPEYVRIQQELAKVNSNFDDIEHSAKLPALKQLLLDCGIGIEGTTSVNQHRALIFCQLKAMLDIVENDLLKKHLPAVTYLRLDGSVPPPSRHHIVTKFNTDPSIDVLLLTTQVGGLGLNLTGADTVIFVEHDWNPMKDLQAMDRAHRIGQKKVVNVYRLITRKSLEEKIMGLQKFKLITANTVVSDENASMETMATDQLFDLFSFSDKTKPATAAINLTTSSSSSSSVQNFDNNGSSSTTGQVTMKNVLEGLPELWEDTQYEEEYDLTQFLKSLK